MLSIHYIPSTENVKQEEKNPRRQLLKKMDNIQTLTVNSHL